MVNCILNYKEISDLYKEFAKTGELHEGYIPVLSSSPEIVEMIVQFYDNPDFPKFNAFIKDVNWSKLTEMAITQTLITGTLDFYINAPWDKNMLDAANIKFIPDVGENIFHGYLQYVE